MKLSTIRQFAEPHARRLLRQGIEHKWTVAGALAFVTLLWPRKAKAPTRYITNAERDRIFGPLTYVAAPRTGDPEAIRITNDFPRKVIRRVMPIIGAVDIHEKVAEPLYRALKAIERDGHASKVESFEGSYVPRFVRGSTTNLSSHSYATSVDINARTNPRGGSATANQRIIAPYFEREGFFWGNNFTSIPDPHHFEYNGGVA